MRHAAPLARLPAAALLAALLAACQTTGEAPPDAPPTTPALESTALPAPALPEQTSPPAPPVPHIYMALQPGGAGGQVSAVFAIDAARDNTPPRTTRRSA